jgi:hypothetical protein
MKAVLHFDLNNEAEANQFKIITKANALQAALDEMSNYLRTLAKYSELTPEQDEIVDEIRSKYNEYLGEFIN